jgi:Pyruvate ferredoxin/flavodoxin oxidoreductase
MNKPVMSEGSLIIAGVGGQGVILASNIVAEVCLMSGLDVKKAEVHGMSQRGGVVTSQVRFGPEVHAALVEPGQVDYIVAFEWAEVLRWLGYLHQGGMAIARWVPTKALQVNLQAFDLGRRQPTTQTCVPVPTKPPELRATYQVTLEPAWCKGCTICLDVCP